MVLLADDLQTGRSERRRESALPSVRALQTVSKAPPLVASNWLTLQNQAVKLYDCTVGHVVCFLYLVDIRSGLQACFLLLTGVKVE